MCRVLGLSASSYYAWLRRGPSPRGRRDAQLTERIKDIWSANREVYGRPRIHAELQASGERIGAKRVGRLMRAAGIAGASRRRSAKTTRRDQRAARVAPDLVDRDFSAAGADRLWVADITYVRTWAGFLYLAVVLDAWSRRVVGWSMASHLRTELVLDALNMAIWQRRPRGVVHHSDQGSQYTSIAFGTRCKETGVRPSTGSVGDAYDNALCESFFATQWVHSSTIGHVSSAPPEMPYVGFSHGTAQSSGALKLTTALPGTIATTLSLIPGYGGAVPGLTVASSQRSS